MILNAKFALRLLSYVLYQARAAVMCRSFYGGMYRLPALVGDFERHGVGVGTSVPLGSPANDREYIELFEIIYPAQSQ